MKTFQNERAAWLYLAGLCDKPELNRRHGPSPLIVVKGQQFMEPTGAAAGLCSAILLLCSYDYISTGIYMAMNHRLRRHMQRAGLRWGTYLYERTRAGMRQRARLCRKFAKDIIDDCCGSD